MTKRSGEFVDKNLDLVISAIRDVAIVSKRLCEAGMPPAIAFRPLRDAVFRWWESPGISRYDTRRIHSVEARAARSDGRDEKFIRDHAVPLNLVFSDLFKGEIDDASVHSMLDNRIVLVVLLKSEDDTLNRLGLRSQMPKDASLDDVFLRYHAANIPLEPGHREANGRGRSFSYSC